VPRGDHVDVELSGRTVRVTSPDKVMFPERGETKLDLVRYYESIEVPLIGLGFEEPILRQTGPGARLCPGGRS